MEKNNITTYQQKNSIALTGILTAITIILGFMEQMFPLPIFGVKLGLANIAIMLGIYLLPFRQTMTIALLKSILIPIITGNLFVRISIGLPATMISFFTMYVFYKLTHKYSSSISMGALGAFVHICIQFVMIKLLFIKSLAIYMLLPYFSFLAIISGILTGYLVAIILKNSKLKYLNKSF